MSEQVVELDHPRFRRASLAVFTERVVTDCTSHRCTIRDTGRVKLDACCQYGCDVTLHERDAIAARAESIRPLLRVDAQEVPWFDESEPEDDPDVPSGVVVRTATHDDGCVFLAHDRRGCAIHRAAVEQGWDYHGVKPAICRLFPLSYGEGELLVSDDYPDYSCAHVDGAPTLYRAARDAIAALFGPELVRAMDAVESRIERRRLPVV